MSFKKIYSLIPFTSLIKLMVGLSIGIQLIVISYSIITGYYTIDGPIHFMRKLFWGSTLSLIGAFLIIYPDLFFIHYLNTHWNWSKKTLPRIVIQFCITIIFAALVSTGITMISQLIGPYKESLSEVLVTNAMIFSVCNIIIMISLEAWILFIEKNESKKEAKELERKVSQIRYEVLKNQINPHFMFNSLNVLSGLIENDKEKSQQFVEEFSQIYRYVVETIEQYVVTVEAELSFARSYMFLQKIRYGEHLHFDIDIPSHVIKMYLPPLSLQLVLENAIKHNVVNKEKPLYISIYSKDNDLFVINSIQPKITSRSKIGIGQNNLAQRYAMICDDIPHFRVRANKYEVRLPLIKEENDEDPDN